MNKRKNYCEKQGRAGVCCLSLQTLYPSLWGILAGKKKNTHTPTHTHQFLGVLLENTAIADVAVRKRHHRHDENLIFFTHTILESVKLFFCH